MRPKILDHVALWVADREPITEFVTERLAMHVIERTDKFTLVGTNARRGKLTLFDAEGPRERGAIKHVALRVADLPPDGPTEFEAGEGLQIKLVEAPTDVDYDLDHVALYTRDPPGTAEEWKTLGFNAADPSNAGDPRVEVGGAYVEFHDGDPGDADNPLLNNVAVLVDSADDHTEEAEQRGIVDRVVNAANTQAAFVWRPDLLRIASLDHQP